MFLKFRGSKQSDFALLRRCAIGAIALAAALMGLEQLSLRGQNGEGKGRDGMFITVPHPISKGVVEQVKAKIEDAVIRQKRHALSVVVFDFTPEGKPSGTTDFLDSKRLQEYILSINQNQANTAFPRNITTIAFVHGDVHRHSVLPVLACSQVIMSSDAKIGPIPGPSDFLKNDVKESYRQLAEPKGIWPAVQKMLDGQSLTSFEARKANLGKEVYESRRAVATALGLPTRSLQEDWTAGGTVIPVKIELNGAATAGNLASFKRRVKSVINDGHNFLILWLNSEGGTDTSRAAWLQEYLRTRKKTPKGLPIKIIAYVPPERNLGAATFLALGASEIVMGENSSLGDFSYLGSRNDTAAATLAELAEQQGYPKALFQATLDPDVVVYRAYSRKNPGVAGFLTKAEWEDDQKSEQPRWSKNKVRITKNNESLLKITTDLAQQSGIATHTDVNNFQQFCERYDDIGDPAEVTVSRGDWLDGIAEFFRRPIVKILLLLIGIAGLILEIKIPGFGLPGIIAAICFVLFFWAHSFVNQYTTLAILLFILGLILLGLEIFVIPGFGITGFSGIGLLIVSLLLVTLDRMPESPEDWQSLGWTLASFFLSFVGAIGVAIAIVSFLPQIPYANRLMLAPPEESPDAEHFDTSAAVTEANAELLGAIGIAETPLRPAGKTRFGEDYVDVVSQGEFILPGSRVQVVEIEGHRIVVKQV